MANNTIKTFALPENKGITLKHRAPIPGHTILLVKGGGPVIKQRKNEYKQDIEGSELKRMYTR